MSKVQRKAIRREPQCFAYVRVSTREQNADRQIIALEPHNIPSANLYVEHQSGKDFERPRYKSMLRRLRAGDLLYIKSIDRLGRDYDEIVEQWRFLTKEKSIDIKVLDIPLLDTTYCKDLLDTFISDLVLAVLSLNAQMERENTLLRQAEGIAAAKAKGVVFGRKPVDLPYDFEEIYRRWRGGSISGDEAARLCGFSVRTLYTLTAGWRGKM